MTVCFCFVRVHDLMNMQEIMKIEAHDQEILCVQYSDLPTGETFIILHVILTQV